MRAHVVRRWACALALAGGAASAGAVPPGTPWTVRHPAGDPVPYQGFLGTAQPRGLEVGGLLYPGPDIVTFVAAVAVHALVNQGVRDAKQQKLQAAANRPLEPLREVLSQVTHAELLRAALARMGPRGNAIPTVEDPHIAGWQVSSVPVFWLTKDLRALILDNAIAFFPPGETRKPTYAVTVRVLSQPLAAADPVEAWRAPGAVQEESARLLAHSLLLALRDSARAPSPDARGRTVAYLEGSAEAMERGEPLEALCRREVLRNLRGWLMSVPVATPEASACDPQDLSEK